MSLVFDAIVKTIKQGRPATDGDSCRYEIEDTGERCVVGHMLTPEQLTWVRDSKGNVLQVANVLAAYGLPLDDSLVSKRFVLHELQLCHDRVADKQGYEFREAFVKLVLEWNTKHDMLTGVQVTEIERLAHA